MAEITKFHKVSDSPEQDMKDYKKKLFQHRAGQGAKRLLFVGVIAGIVLGIWLIARNKTYTAYEVMASVEREDSLNTQYAEYNGKILKYSRDGISCVNVKNEAVWSQAYNMQTPILDVCQNAVVVADYQGNEVYIFDETGIQAQITTLLPIQQISVSSQGITALLLSDSTVSWIYLYDKEGNKLTETRCSLDETGQPLAIAISADSFKLAVSYLQVQSGMASSCVVFYNFGDVGGNFVDKIVASTVYEDLIIPRIRYLDDSICALVSEQGIIYYEGKEIPEEKATAMEEGEIYSVFFGEKAVGLVVEGTEESESRYEMHLYNTEGVRIQSLGTNLAYSKIKISGGDVILYSDNECEIYTENGILRYAGSFDGVIADIYKESGFRKYVVVFSDRTEEIKLK